METISEDDETEKNLDLEFRRILRIIKIYIPCIMNIEYLASYRIWLEKLSASDNLEKHERNRYLLELCRQIQDGILERPFLQPPGIAPLIPYQHNYKGNNVQSPQSTMPQGCTNHQAVSPRNKIQTELSKEVNLTQVTHKANNSDGMPVSEAFPMIQPITNTTIITPEEQIGQSMLTRRLPEKTCYNNGHYSGQNQQNNFQCSNSSSPKELYHFYQPKYSQYQEHYQGQHTMPYGNRENDILSEFCNNIAQQHNANLNNDMEDSSWYDVSECSETMSKMESGDSEGILIPEYLDSNNTIDAQKVHEMCESRIIDLTDIITELRKQNLCLNTRAEIIIQNLSEELSGLKNKVYKFKEIKTAIKNGLIGTTSQWQNTVDKLRNKLQKVQSENSSLKTEISRLKKTTVDFSMQKQCENSTMRQKLSDMYNKEIEMLKQNYVKHIVDMESKYSQILNDKDKIYNKTLSELTELYNKKKSSYE